MTTVAQCFIVMVTVLQGVRVSSVRYWPTSSTNYRCKCCTRVDDVTNCRFYFALFFFSILGWQTFFDSRLTSATRENSGSCRCTRECRPLSRGRCSRGHRRDAARYFEEMTLSTIWVHSTSIARECNSALMWKAVHCTVWWTNLKYRASTIVQCFVTFFPVIWRLEPRKGNQE